jgi:hypothetical protein
MRENCYVNSPAGAVTGCNIRLVKALAQDLVEALDLPIFFDHVVTGIDCSAAGAAKHTAKQTFTGGDMRCEPNEFASTGQPMLGCNQCGSPFEAAALGERIWLYLGMLPAVLSRTKGVVSWLHSEGSAGDGAAGGCSRRAASASICRCCSASRTPSSTWASASSTKCRVIQCWPVSEDAHARQCLLPTIELLLQPRWQCAHGLTCGQVRTCIGCRSCCCPVAILAEGRRHV